MRRVDYRERPNQANNHANEQKIMNINNYREHSL